MPVLERERTNPQFTPKTELSFSRRSPAKLIMPRMVSLGKEVSSGNNAFRLERYETPLNKEALKEDVISYLGEYRFSLPKYSYKLKFENDHLVDPTKKVSLEDMAHKSIGIRLLEDKSTYREIAEKEGIQALDRQLSQAKAGDTIIWVSPPGEKSEGYGNYGFVFYGTVGKNKDISMTAIRVNGIDLEKYNKAFEMATGVKGPHPTSESFIKEPYVGKSIPEGYLDAILGLTLGFQDSEEEKKKFRAVIETLVPVIDDFADNLESYTTSSEKKRAFFSMENYALYLKERYENNLSDKRVSLSDFKNLVKVEDIRMFNYEPPKVAGSCGSTGGDNSITSSNIFNKLSSINSFLSDSEQEWFKCPKCKYQADGPIGETCPGCGLTKQDYAEETGVSCD